MAETGLRTRRRLRYVLLAILSAAFLAVAAALLLSTLNRQYQTTHHELSGAQCILHLQDVAILV